MAKPTLPDFTPPSTINWGWLKTVLTNRLPSLMTAFFSTMKDNGVFKDEHLPINKLNPAQFDQGVDVDGITPLFTIKSSVLAPAAANPAASYTFAQWMIDIKARPGYNAADPSSVVLDGNINWIPKPTGSGTGPTTTQLATPVPGVSAITATGMTVSWPAIDGATSYQGDYSTAANPTTWISFTTDNRLSVPITNLASSSAYNFRVRAVSTDTTKTQSNYGTTSGTTLAASNPGATALAAPVLGSPEQVTHNSLKLVWSASPNATGYTVMEAIESGAFSVKQVLGNVLTLSITGLTPLTSYKYKVYATSTDTNFSPSVDSNTITVPTAADPNAVFPQSFTMVPLDQDADWTRVEGGIVRAGNDFTATANGHAYSSRKIAAGAEGVVQASFPRGKQQGFLRLAKSTTNSAWEWFYSMNVDPNTIINVTKDTNAGSLGVGATGGTSSGTGTNPQLTGRYRVTATRIFYDYSKDDGANWVNFGSTPRPTVNSDGTGATVDLWIRTGVNDATGIVNDVMGNNLV